MKDIAVKDVRNFAVAGHSGSGKTALCDAMLVKMGVSAPAGGASISDYTDEEISRKSSIYATPLSAVYKNPQGVKTKLMFTDTPGTDDFFGQVQTALHAADAVLIAVDAVSGIQVGTRAAWRQCENRSLPRAVVITGMDRESADFAKTLGELQGTWGGECVPVIAWVDGQPVSLLDARAKLSDAAAETRNALLEKAAETDDALIEKFLGGEELTPAEVEKGLRAVKAGVWCRFLPLRHRKMPVWWSCWMVSSALSIAGGLPHEGCSGANSGHRAGCAVQRLVWRSLTDRMPASWRFSVSSAGHCGKG